MASLILSRYPVRGGAVLRGYSVSAFNSYYRSRSNRMFFKQSTASQPMLLGPFVDDTDGVTAETGLTVANTDIRLSKNGANMIAKASGGGTHDENGWYTITLDATDTDTVGSTQISCKIAGALPVSMEITVLEENVYAAWFAASAAAGTDLATILTDTVTDLPALIATAQSDLDIITGASGVNLLTATQTSIDAVDTDWANGGRLDLLLDAIKAITDTLTLAAINAESDTAWTTQMADSVSTDGTIATREQALYLILQQLTEFAVSSTTWTTKKVDGSTTLATFTLDDATNPTSMTRAS